MTDQLFTVSATSPRQLAVRVTHSRELVCRLINEWHSCRRAPQGWRVAFLLLDGNAIVGAATWGRPVARLEDQITTLEHTRMALSTDAPRNSGTYFLAQMRAWIRENMPEIKRLISYVPLDIHTGIIYRGDNWKTVYKKKTRHNWQNRPGRTGRASDIKAKFERKP